MAGRIASAYTNHYQSPCVYLLARGWLFGLRYPVLIRNIIHHSKVSNNVYHLVSMNFSTQVISFEGNIFMSFMRQARDISIRMTVKGNGARIYPRGQMHQIYLSIFVQRDQLPPLIHRQSQTFLQQQSHNKNKIQRRVHVPTLLPTMQPCMASHHNHHFRQLCPNSEVSLSSSSLIFFYVHQMSKQ